MKRLFILGALLAVVAIASAQTAPSNTATWAWSAVTAYTDGTAIPSTVPVTYNLYVGTGGPGSEASTPAQSGVSVLTVVTSGYTAGQVVCGQLTAVANGVEGARSNEACKTFPAVPGVTTLTVE